MEDINTIRNELNQINNQKNDIAKRYKDAIDKLKIYKHTEMDKKLKLKTSYYMNNYLRFEVVFHDGYKIYIYKLYHIMDYESFLIMELTPLLNWIDDNPYTISSLYYTYGENARESSYGGTYGDDKTLLTLRYNFESLYENLDNINLLHNIIRQILHSRGN
jgi:hypothetical protein